MNYDHYLVKQAMEELRKDDGKMSYDDLKRDRARMDAIRGQVARQTGMGGDRYSKHLGVNALNDSYLKQMSKLNTNEFIEAVDKKRVELDKQFKARASAGGGDYRQILSDYKNRVQIGDMSPDRAIENSAIQKLINEQTGDTSHISTAKKNRDIMRTIEQAKAAGPKATEITGFGDPTTLEGAQKNADIAQNRGNKLFNQYQSTQEKLGRLEAPKAAGTTSTQPSPSIMRRISSIGSNVLPGMRRILPGRFGRGVQTGASIAGALGLGAAAGKIADYFKRGETDEEIIKEVVGEFLKKAKKKKGKKKDPRLERAGVEGYNKPKRTPKHPKKSHIVVAKEGNKIKTIRYGEQGAKTAGDPKKGESAKMKKKRKSFKARHRKNIKRGKMSAAYWADKSKW